MLVAVSIAVTLAGCAADPVAPLPMPLTPDADRPSPDGGVVRRCGSHYAEEFDAGLEARTLAAGSVSLVSFRVTPVPAGTAGATTFKVMVRLAAGVETRLETITPGTTLLYDRARFADTNGYRLSDGERSVQFVGCPDRPAVFNGAVLSTGPTAVVLQVFTGDDRRTVRIAAYAG